jgi:hypothetical protein
MISDKYGGAEHSDYPLDYTNHNQFPEQNTDCSVDRYLQFDLLIEKSLTHRSDLVP